MTDFYAGVILAVLWLFLLAWLLSRARRRLRVWRFKRDLRRNREGIDAARREAERRDVPVEDEEE